MGDGRNRLRRALLGDAALVAHAGDLHRPRKVRRPPRSIRFHGTPHADRRLPGAACARVLRRTSPEGACENGWPLHSARGLDGCRRILRQPAHSDVRAQILRIGELKKQSPVVGARILQTRRHLRAIPAGSPRLRAIGAARVTALSPCWFLFKTARHATPPQASATSRLQQ